MRRTHRRRSTRRNNRTRKHGGKVWNPFTSKYGLGYGKTKRHGQYLMNDKESNIDYNDVYGAKYKDEPNVNYDDIYAKHVGDFNYEKRRDLQNAYKKEHGPREKYKWGGRRTRRHRRH
jgi:hypothetical protein